ncbi:MAG: 2-dehydropantoate 2-reductase [Candidatus Eremiobacteraeota bacterium]|nr:2-dehydropantoate 2-reductase [Candidatus Eremiobacteraeota bacterium]MBV9055210.1 2-dehydropantoate 2-reductase [Candidatus Eremiobacteraeota bacterium]MBV9698536.1 2-dehydropantoate 2-reductase [Candidatus Eremiobacteraeota bacterium]
MRVAVVGAGAIGGFVAAALAKAGVPVAIVARGAHLSAIQRHGLQVQGDLGTFSVRLEASADLARLGSFDALLLTFKAHQWPQLLPQLEPFAATATTIVTLQNGLPFWYVREPPLRSVDPGGAIERLFADEQVVGGVVHVSGEVVAPGEIRQSGGLRYVLGAPDRGDSEAARRLVELFAGAGLAAELDTNIRATVWLKLVNNAALNSLSVLRRSTIKPLLGDPGVRAHARRLMVEALQVGEAMNVVSDVDVDARLEYAARLNDVKTSTLQDYERGRPLELEPILGAVIELADRFGVEVPSLRAAYAALKTSAPPERLR